MKIALLTIWHCGNYGAELQAYATVRALLELGHDVSIIDFRLSDKTQKTLKQLAAEFIMKFTPAYNGFVFFWSKYLPNKTKHYKSIEQLEKNPPVADIYLVGSDQVWNLNITQELAKAYFLDFGNSSISRCSYASSFGENLWSESDAITKAVGVQLSKFKLISCRESTGIKILKDVFGVDADLVLDPTLLFSSYPEITGNICEEKTFVYYPLTVDKNDEIVYKRFANELKLKYVNINKKRLLTNTIPWTRTSIIDWIKNIASAKFVVTPSFHGLAFSLIYHRQFAVIGTNSSRNNRIIDLLELLGLPNRYFSTFNEFYKSKIWKHQIDYDNVDAKLDMLREYSWNYLKKIQ